MITTFYWDILSEFRLFAAVNNLMMGISFLSLFKGSVPMNKLLAPVYLQ